MATEWVRRCVETYRELRDLQLVRADEYAIGYATDRAIYFDKVEPRITYRDVLVSVAAEIRAEREAERVEVEFWQTAEREHFAVWLDETVVDVVAEDASDATFRSRFAALVWSALARRSVAVVSVARTVHRRITRRALTVSPTAHVVSQHHSEALRVTWCAEVVAGRSPPDALDTE